MGVQRFAYSEVTVAPEPVAQNPSVRLKNPVLLPANGPFYGRQAEEARENAREGQQGTRKKKKKKTQPNRTQSLLTFTVYQSVRNIIAVFRLTFNTNVLSINGQSGTTLAGNIMPFLTLK